MRTDLIIGSPFNIPLLQYSNLPDQVDIKAKYRLISAKNPLGDQVAFSELLEFLKRTVAWVVGGWPFKRSFLL